MQTHRQQATGIQERHRAKKHGIKTTVRKQKPNTTRNQPKELKKANATAYARGTGRESQETEERGDETKWREGETVRAGEENSKPRRAGESDTHQRDRRRCQEEKLSSPACFVSEKQQTVLE